jgi:hypothetical protein
MKRAIIMAMAITLSVVYVNEQVKDFKKLAAKYKQ